MNSVVEHLERAYLLLMEGWTTEQYRARHFVDGSVESRVCFCAAGAVRAASVSDPMDLTYPLPRGRTGTCRVALELLASVAFGRRIRGFVNAEEALTLWNDKLGRTQEEVLAVFAKAIALAREEGA